MPAFCPRRKAARQELYINDGAYGALFDAAHIGWRYPVKLVREKPRTLGRWFSFYGSDLRRSRPYGGPFDFRDVQAGDYIEVGMLGALWLRDADRLQRLRSEDHVDRR
jgi:ornithine decarboxylase